MRFPLMVTDEHGAPIGAVNDIDQLYDFLDEADNGEVYEVMNPDDDRNLVLFKGFRSAFCYNPVSFAQLHSFVLYEWPELLETCPVCGCTEPTYNNTRGYRYACICPDCGTEYNPIDMDALVQGKMVRRR